MGRLIWGEPALQDLDQIADYIALDNESAAKRLVTEVFRLVDQLAEFPEMCPVARELPGGGYRHLVVGPLRIFYRVDGDTVFLVYVMRHERLLTLGDVLAHDQGTKNPPPAD